MVYILAIMGMVLLLGGGMQASALLYLYLVGILLYLATQVPACRCLFDGYERPPTHVPVCVALYESVIVTFVAKHHKRLPACRSS